MSTYKKILTMPLRLSIVILLMGMLMKVLEWPLAQEVMFVSFATIGILYVFRFFKKPSRQFIDYVKMVLVFFWTTNGIFNIMDFPYTVLFQVIIAISFVLWFILEGTAYFLDDDRRAKNSTRQLIWNFVMVAGTLAIIVGSILKILNWEFALPLLIIGILVLAAYILKDVFVVDKIAAEDHNNEEFQL
ncbi:MAG: hypothetical protein KJO52_07320 [Maribacter sp.]|nr:hypothetical protein [Maribacter sp.]MBT8301749.1 hypothetical protein [Maribacter sp.]